MKGCLDQLFVLEPADRSAADSKQLRVPTLEERVELYLHAVYGNRDFTNEEYSRARGRMLDAMAANVVAKSGMHLGSQTLPRGASRQPAVISTSPTITSWDYDRGAASAVAPRVAALEGNAPADVLVVQEETRLAQAPARRLTTRRMAAAAASVALLLFVVPPIIWRPTDQNSSGSRLALAPVAPVAPVTPVAPPAAAVASAAPVVPVARAPLAPVAFVESAWKADSLLARPADITQAPPLLTWNVVRRGLHLLAQGQITDARQLLLHWESQGAERDAAVALSLGTSYDPIELEQLRSATASPNVVPDSFADIAMARTWYQKAKDLGSIEAERRLESLAARESQPRPSKQSEAVATVALESGTGADQNSAGSQVAVQSSPSPQSDPSAPPTHGAVATLMKLENAAKQGVPEAIWKLGRMYADGDGVETNRARAYEYFRRLIALRVTSATANNSSSAVTTAPANNRSSAPNARFLANAFVTLGLYHLEGIPGTLKADPNVAREMFRYAAFFRRLMSV